MNTNKQTTPKTKSVIAKADQKTTGVRKLRRMRLFLNFLNFGSLSDGSTPLLYFIDVKIALGINSSEINTNESILITTAVAMLKFIIHSFGMWVCISPNCSFVSIIFLISG
mmetsp:Transcript_11681/g.14564  ORF Transcript_11681/g.14564 Transcript_11681/m.14564 type:complete len:111 (-) Transcript_11681:1779-2111(-)